MILPNSGAAKKKLVAVIKDIALAILGGMRGRHVAPAPLYLPVNALNDARYIKLLFFMGKYVSKRHLDGDFSAFDRLPCSRQKCFRGTKYTQ